MDDASYSTGPGPGSAPMPPDRPAVLAVLEGSAAVTVVDAPSWYGTASLARRWVDEARTHGEESVRVGALGADGGREGLGRAVSDALGAARNADGIRLLVDPSGAATADTAPDGCASQVGNVLPEGALADLVDTARRTTGLRILVVARLPEEPADLGTAGGAVPVIGPDDLALTDAEFRTWLHDRGIALPESSASAANAYLGGVPALVSTAEPELRAFASVATRPDGGGHLDPGNAVS